MRRHLSWAFLTLALAAAHAVAQSPARPLRIVVPAAAGGPTDLVARVIAPALGRHLGRPVIVENRGGAGGIVGTEAVAKSAPDGTTVALVFISHATNPAMNAKLPYDTLTSFTPVVLVGQQPLLLVAHPSLAAANVKELVALAKARPGELNYAADTASAPHLAAELLKHETGTRIVHVPYKGNGPALSDVLSGQIPFMFNTVNTSLPHVRAGTLRALATTGSNRSALAPEIPTMVESGLPGVVVTAWYALVAPAGTPRETIAQLNAAMNESLREPELRKLFSSQGVELAGGTPAELDAFIHAEIAKWGTIIRAAGFSAN
jgi:tripartite-type tricarboxylate transporter receptor subunit TctC